MDITQEIDNALGLTTSSVDQNALHGTSKELEQPKSLAETLPTGTMENTLEQQDNTKDALAKYKKFVLWLKKNSLYKADEHRPFHEQLKDFSIFLSEKFMVVEKVHDALQSISTSEEPSSLPEIQLGTQTLTPQSIESAAVVLHSILSKTKNASSASTLPSSKSTDQKRRESSQSDKTEEIEENYQAAHYENISKRRPNFKYFCCCGRMFPGASKLNKHINHFNRPRNFECRKCSKSFLYRTQLKHHKCGSGCRNTSYRLLKHSLGNTSPEIGLCSDHNANNISNSSSFWGSGYQNEEFFDQPRISNVTSRKSSDIDLENEA